MGADELHAVEHLLLDADSRASLDLVDGQVGFGLASTLDADRRHAVSAIVAPVAALHLDGGARVGMIRHLTEGPADGMHATTAEAGDAHAMLDALGFAGSCIYMPFALRLRSLVERRDRHRPDA